MNKNDTISFAQKLLAQIGITHEQNTVVYRTWKGEEVEGQIIFSDHNDDALFRFLTPYGSEAIYYNKNNNPTPFLLRRQKEPTGKNKYLNPYRADALPFIPPPLITKVKAGIEINTLYITEGAKKAFVASLKGLDCIGIPGIFQFKVKGTKELHPYILTVINECKVKNIVLLFDADAHCLTSHDEDLQPGDLAIKDLAFRSNIFASAAKSLKETCIGMNIDAHVGNIKPEHKAKGLDDLFVVMPNDTDEIISDALLLSKANSYFDILCLKDNSYNKLNEWLGLDNVDSFYKIHQHKLGINDFNYRNKIYRYDPEGEFVKISANNYAKFWYEDKGSYKIDIKDFLEFLSENGFRLYRLNIHDFYYVQIKNNIVSIVATKDIKDFACSYIEQLKILPENTRHQILNALLLFSSLFSKEKLESLKAISNNFHTDAPDRMFFYFKNGFVEVTKTSTQLRDYKELSGYIWETQILPRNYNQPEKGALKDFMFVKFIQNICSIRANKRWKLDKERLESFVSILGYVLHTVKRERKAIVFTDTDISDNPEGRTGKTIVGKALGQLRVYSEIDGKNFNPDDRFKYQNATIDTQILHINDAGRGKKKFDFELLFTAITEGVTVEKKNQASFIINPTIIISSNRAIEIQGGSAKARVIEFEFANYYSDTFSPKDDFDVWFFEDWSPKDWNLFYYFLFNCARSYLANGIIKPLTVNLDKRKLIQETGNSEDFLEFAEGYVTVGIDISKSKLLADFKKENPEFDQITSQTFTKWLKAYAIYKSYSIEDGKKIDGDRHIIFKGKTVD